MDWKEVYQLCIDPMKEIHGALLGGLAWLIAVIVIFTAFFTVAKRINGIKPVKMKLWKKLILTALALNCAGFFYYHLSSRPAVVYGTITGKTVGSHYSKIIDMEVTQACLLTEEGKGEELSDLTGSQSLEANWDLYEMTEIGTEAVLLCDNRLTDAYGKIENGEVVITFSSQKTEKHPLSKKKVPDAVLTVLNPSRQPAGEKAQTDAAHEKSGPKPGEPWTEPLTGMEFVWVPGGCYQMGDIFNDNYYDYEKPVHKVCLDGFWMGKYEVTQAEYRKITGENPSKFQGDRRPVEMVSWDDAQAFISKLNRLSSQTFALPSEAQWEYAARSGGKRQRYAGGDDPDKAAWYDPNSGKRTHDVGTKAPNSLGLYDMSGNVFEWCQDLWDPYAYTRPALNNPLVLTSTEKERICRGGAWNLDEMNIRTTERGAFYPTEFYRLGGFRLTLRPQAGMDERQTGRSVIGGLE